MTHHLINVPVFAQKMKKWHEYRSSPVWYPGAATHAYPMNPGLFIISPLISLVLLLMPPGPRWHCKHCNHRLTHTPMHMHTCTFVGTYHAAKILSNYWFSINYFLKLTVFIRRLSQQLGSSALLVIGWVCSHSGYKTGRFWVHQLPGGLWAFYVGTAMLFLVVAGKTGGNHWSVCS